jgi:hypothetical protein
MPDTEWKQIVPGKYFRNPAIDAGTWLHLATTLFHGRSSHGHASLRRAGIYAVACKRALSQPPSTEIT